MLPILHLGGPVHPLNEGYLTVGSIPEEQELILAAQVGRIWNSLKIYANCFHFLKRNIH